MIFCVRIISAIRLWKEWYSIKTYYARGREVYNQELGEKESLFINNFGYFRGIEEKIPTLRPSGRADYHIIYVSSGEVRVGERSLKNGDFCLFFPKTPQSYTYLPSEHSLYYWCHFTGRTVEALLAENRLSEGVYTDNGRKQETDTLFTLIYDAARRSDGLNSKYLHLLFSALLSLLSSRIEAAYPYKRAVEMLEDITAEVSVQELAKMYKVSIPHFIRSFKQSYGATPCQYRISCQLALARNLLQDTALPLSAVAEECGFSDPFYFSRLFKRHTGISPSHFRETETKD